MAGTDPLAPSQLTLGILAGGQATRLGGRDKAWIQLDREPQVLRIAGAFRDRCGRVLVSANAGLERYGAVGLEAVPDTIAGVGPIAGLQALAGRCETPWLLTVPVDLVHADTAVLDALLSTAGRAASAGAMVEDDDGVQPLVAVYRCEALRDGVRAALDAGEHAVHALQARLGMGRVRVPGCRLGNLNTPADLRVAGYGDG